MDSQRDMVLTNVTQTRWDKPDFISFTNNHILFNLAS